MTAPDPTAGERECRYPCGCGQFPDEHCACMDGHAPAAPETDVRLTEAIERGLRKCRVEDAPVSLIKEHDLFHVTHMVAAELAPLIAERVRVVEGERDALDERVDTLRDELSYAIRTRDEWKSNAEDAEARAFTAEAAHAELVAAVEALADEWAEDYPGPTAACNRTPDEWARDLRALLAGGEER